jgi:hypothetical protein
MSEPVKPIQYWVDSGAPEDVKKALVEGASWWNQAFEAAGFKNGFKVDVLPEGADPMDIRYNMINWVHRSTRGWSSGGSVADPRTGEILKATVTLGSLRDRQDYMIFEGLLSPYANGSEKPSVMYETALKRIRQLSAHEVGHTLGLGHNYYDSEKGWISVMDYPHPLEKLNADGSIDLSEAYQARIGDWDKVTINYGYRQFAPGTDEKAGLTKILDDAWAQDLRYMTNQDTDSNPKVDQWSNGVDQADELLRLMKVRRSALSRIGEHTIRAGAPLATIEEPLVPVYMYHRYAVEAAASMVAGQDYIYGMRGDNRTPTKGVSVDDQRKALDALAVTLRPSELTVPKPVLDLIPPRPPGWGLHRELFPRTTGDTFDPLSPATVAADVTIGFVLQLDRASRMVAQHAVNAQYPGLEDVIERPDHRDVGRADCHTVRGGNPAGGRESAGRSDHVAGARLAEQSGAGDRVDEAVEARGACEDRGQQDGAGHRTAHADRRRHQAVPRASRSICSGRSPCRRPTPHRGPRLATRAGIGWPRPPGTRAPRSIGITGRSPSCRPRSQLLRSELNLINIVIKLRELNGRKRLASLDEVDRRLALPDRARAPG